MNSLLQRQLKKYLQPSDLDNEALQQFLEAVDTSYETHMEQFQMLQRAMRISSDELFEANQQLRKEAEGQREILDSISFTIHALNLKETKKTEGRVKLTNLASYIREQSDELQKAVLEQKNLMESLELKNQVLTDYAHMVSHDLKTPLRSIDTLTTWIVEDNFEVLDNSGKDNFKMILKNVEKMDALIDGILHYSTIDQAILNQYPVNIKDLVEEIVELLVVPENVHIQIDSKLPTIKGDQYRLQQLFQNLIHNAVKSIDSDQGTVEINVLESEDYWRFEVKDNGRGISKKYHDKIFRIFEKIDEDQSSTGIGLSIVKRVIDYYGGIISLESIKGKGTSFYFNLPK